MFKEGDHVPLHIPIGVITFTSDNVEKMCEMIKYINSNISIPDESGEELYIRYTDFDYLRKIYQDGLEGK